MGENSRPPVAIRIVRPYASEDELLEHELETVGKTSVVLIGAHPRPTGVILRFEVTLSSGVTVLRGEGRVLAHKENAFRGQPGLTLRFTRLDPRSKSVVDRAAAMREARASGPASSQGGSASRRSVAPKQAPQQPGPDRAIAAALTASTPAPSPTTAEVDARAVEQADDDAAFARAKADASAKASTGQEATISSARASAREKANAVARANAKRTGRAESLTPPPVPVAEEATPAGQLDAMRAGDLDIEPAPQTDAAPYVDGAAQADGEPTSAAEAAEAAEEEAAPIEAPREASISPDAITANSAELSNAMADMRSQPRAPTPRTPETAARVGAPPNRAELLARLRDRAGTLPPERVREILAARR